MMKTIACEHTLKTLNWIGYKTKGAKALIEGGCRNLITDFIKTI